MYLGHTLKAIAQGSAWDTEMTVPLGWPRVMHLRRYTWSLAESISTADAVSIVRLALTANSVGCASSVLRYCICFGRFHVLTLLLLATDGNAETNNDDDGAGTMECVYFGTWNATRSGWCGGSGPGPWVMADLENGLWACDKPRTVYSKNVPPTGAFVTAMVKGDSANHWSIKSGDAQSGRLSTMFDGERPPGYHPMKKQGAIILGKRVPDYARLFHRVPLLLCWVVKLNALKVLGCFPTQELAGITQMALSVRSSRAR